MTVKHSTKRPTSKPAKPKDFPLFPHAAGQWAKKVKGKLRYFGVWDDPDAALELWLHQKDYLIAGRIPPPLGHTSLTVKELCNQFLDSVKRKVATGERAEKTFHNYVITAKKVCQHFGKQTPVESLNKDQFAKLRYKWATEVSLNTLAGRIREARAIFNYGDKNGLIEIPLRKLWGTEFQLPERKPLEAEKNRKGKKELTADEINAMLKIASPELKAMILLGINCGFGNTDCGHLRIENIKNGFVELVRSKTGKGRRCPLWKETQEALKAVTGNRDSGPVFITKYGNSFLPCSRESAKGNISTGDPIAQEIIKLRKAAGITGRGKGFYTLRHMFQTIGDETLDFVAVKFIMGHADKSISDTYRGKIDDKRLRKVTNHVRKWLFKKTSK